MTNHPIASPDRVTADSITLLARHVSRCRRYPLDVRAQARQVLRWAPEVDVESVASCALVVSAYAYLGARVRREAVIAARHVLGIFLSRQTRNQLGETDVH